MRSLVLIGLIALSLALSFKLWAGNETPQPLTTDPARIRTAGERPGTDALLSPDQVILHLGRDRHTVLGPGDAGYDQAWRWGARRLAALDNSEPAGGRPEVLAQEISARRASSGLEMVLPLALSPEEWLGAWDGFKHGPTRPAVRRVYFSAQRPATVFFWSDGKTPTDRVAWPGGEDDLAQFLSGLTQAAGVFPEYAELRGKIGQLDLSPGIYVPADPVQIPIIAGISDPPGATRDPGLEASRFFLDLSVVRTVRERDGALIYTDGRKGLRVYPGGSLEYTAVPPSTGDFTTLWEALDGAREFVSTYGGWPELPRLEAAIPGDQGWRLRFSYRLGSLRAAGQYGPLEIIMRGLNVIEFRRSLTLPAGPATGSIKEGPRVRVIDPAEAVETVGRGWGTAFPGERSRPVRSVELVYWVPHRLESAAEIRPAWKVGFDDLTAFVDAVNGRLFP